ncbi:SDR family oxidoreductase [Micromonospora sp. NPDC005206]|uniref:SDR family NAD(P)-dependent oxidoreductase n=1 Tax=Micromonospora sp. NPDC005206 TaxID=3157022 RepID=UPI0033BF8D92
MAGVDVRDRGEVVTSADHGIGRAIAAKLAGGARVVVNDLDAAAVRLVAEEIGGIAVPGHAASEVAVLVESTQQQARRDRHLFRQRIDTGKGLDTPEDDLARVLDVNVMAHIRAARLLVPAWLASAGGRFVVTTYTAGLLRMTGSAPYSVTKHAAVAFAEWLSITYGQRGVTVQAICPQDMKARMFDDCRTAGRAAQRRHRAHPGASRGGGLARAAARPLPDPAASASCGVLNRPLAQWDAQARAATGRRRFGG